MPNSLFLLFISTYLLTVFRFLCLQNQDRPISSMLASFPYLSLTASSCLELSLSYSLSSSLLKNCHLSSFADIRSTPSTSSTALAGHFFEHRCNHIPAVCKPPDISHGHRVNTQILNTTIQSPPRLAVIHVLV